MCMAVYPFFGTVAEATGRLLHLQGTAAAAQVHRRVREQLGERETVSRAARRILRAFVDWGVLVETVEKGLYRGASKQSVQDVQLLIWTIKAILIAKGNRPQTLFAALRGPHLFPFDIEPPPIRDLEDCPAIEITWHGLNQDVLLGLPKSTSD